MKTNLTNIAFCSALACSVIALCPPAARAQRITPSASQGGVSWQINAPSGGGTLRVSAPDGSVFEKHFASGESPSYASPSGVLPDGQYVYEVVLAPVASAEARAESKPADADNGARASARTMKESGAFRVANGTVALKTVATEPKQASVGQNGQPAPEAQTIADSVTIQGNNTRVNFDDNSTSGNPTNNWQLRANQFSGGTAEFFGIVDQGATATGDETGTIILQLDAGAPADSLHIDSAGRVGIGTAVPSTNLAIATNVNPAIRLEQTNASIPRIFDITSNNSTGFRIRDVTAGTSPLTIASDSGNVGIGITSPSGRLHVNGAGAQLSIFESSDNNAVQFRLQTNSTNRRFVALNAGGTQQSQLVFNDNGAFDFLGGTASDVRMTLIASGNVGIGTTAPDQKLTVNGNASKPGGGSWATFSDERLKNIKGDFKGGLDQVMKLNPIRYEYKADNAIGLKSEGEHVGFGAAAVSEVIPEAVTRSANGYLMIDNDPILWTMLNAIKEQNTQITDLKDQVKRLQAEVVLQAAAKKPADKKVAKSGR